MRLFVTIFFAVVSVSSAQQQQVDPAYLRQYYAQLAQQGGARGAPIYETQDQPQYVQQQPQQLKNYQRPAQHQQQQQVQYVPEPQQQHQPRQYQQPQQVQYQQPKAAPKQPKRPAFPQETEEELPEDYDPNPSYQFGFDVKDDEFTNYQNRKEQREGGVIKGSYSVVDSDGFIRTVTYTADPKEGFKAEVVREPTDIVVKTPTPAPQTSQPQHGFRQAAPKHSQPQYVPSQQPEQHQQQYRQQAAPARPDYAQYQQ